ncbi:MAG: ribosome-associated translation inhibitor RaiA [Kofleriaceae bacterium]
MQLSVTFRHMEPTDSLKVYARERMERVRKYLPDPIACHVVLSTERHHHRIDVNFQLHNGMAIAGHETTENMYSSIDLCIAKIERQVRKYKGKLEEQRVRPRAVETLPWSHTIVDESGAATPAPDAVPAPEFKVVKTEEMVARSMNVDEAIVQLNLEHKAFLVFRQAKDGRVAIVYRRDHDGSYGLIETQAQS